MKKIFFILIFLSILFFAKSQIVIQQSDLAQATDTFLIYVDMNPDITIDLIGGENLTWDFSGLTKDYDNFACYAPKQELEFAEEFPLSQFYTYGPGFIYAGPGGGAPLDNWGYMLFYTDNQGLFAEGFYSDYGMGYKSTYNTPPELLMFTPANYLDNKINNSYWEVVVNENSSDYDTIYRRNIDKQLEADAWGNLTSDFGNFEVLRIHETGTSVDSIFGYVGNTTFFKTEVANEIINKYYFWAKHWRNPILTLYCDENNNILRIDYLMGSLFSNITENSFKNLNIYPNPSESSICVKNAKDFIEIYSIDGKLILKHKIINDFETINLTNLSKGIYIIKDASNKQEKLILK